jgi:hypothetical protein
LSTSPATSGKMARSPNSATKADRPPTMIFRSCVRPCDECAIAWKRTRLPFRVAVPVPSPELGRYPGQERRLTRKRQVALRFRQRGERQTRCDPYLSYPVFPGKRCPLQWPNRTEREPLRCSTRLIVEEQRSRRSERFFRPTMAKDGEDSAFCGVAWGDSCLLPPRATRAVAATPPRARANSWRFRSADRLHPPSS